MFCDGTKSAKASALREAMTGGGVVVTTYGMLLHNAGALSGAPEALDDLCGEGTASGMCGDGDDPLWDCVVLDEGHKIKNVRTKLAQAARGLESKMRWVLRVRCLTVVPGLQLPRVLRLALLPPLVRTSPRSLSLPR